MLPDSILAQTGESAPEACKKIREAYDKKFAECDAASLKSKLEQLQGCPSPTSDILFLTEQLLKGRPVAVDQVRAHF